MRSRMLGVVCLVGCYRPAPEPGSPCTARGDCPGGLICDLAAVPPTCVDELHDAAPLPDDPIPPSPITWRETVSGTREAVSFATISTEQAIRVAPDDVFIAVVSVKPVHQVSSVSGLSLTWTRLRQQCGGRNTARLALFRASGPAPVSEKITATLNGGTAFDGSAVISVHRYSGTDPAQPVGNVSYANSNGADTSASCVGGTDTPSYAWTTLATTSPNAVVLSAVHTTRFTHEPGAGYTERSDVQSADSAGAAGVAVQDRVVALPAPGVSVEGSFSGVPDWAAIAVELRPRPE
jgi:hypothetical protein